MQTEKDTWWWS